jgi:hypothetical protein
MEESILLNFNFDIMVCKVFIEKNLLNFHFPAANYML